MATISGSGSQETPPDDGQLKPAPEQTSTGPRSITPLTHSPIPSRIAKLASESTEQTKADLSQKQIVPKNSAEARKEIVEAIQNKTIDVAIAILRSSTNLEKEDLFVVLQHAYDTKSEELIALTIDRGAEPTERQIEQAVHNREYGLLAKLIEPLKNRDPRPDLRMENGSSLIEHCIGQNDTKAIHLLKEVTAFEIDTNWGKRQLVDFALKMDMLDLAEDLLKQQKRLGIPPGKTALSMNEFVSIVKTKNPSKEFLYLVGEQHFGWNALFSDDMKHQRFLELFDNPSCKLPEDLRPMVDLCKAQGKSELFCQSCLSIGLFPKGQSFANKVASLVWEVAQNDPASRMLIFEWPENPMAASLLITHALDEFLQLPQATNRDLSTLLSEAFKRFGETNSSLQKILELALKADTSFTNKGERSLCVAALKLGYFESYFKMVNREISKGEVIDFDAHEKFIAPELKETYNAVKSKHSLLPENIRNTLAAVKNGDMEQLLALSKTDVDLKDPLFMKAAVRDGKWEMVQFLLKQGASFTPADFPQQKDVYQQAVKHNLPDLLSLLKEQGWEVNQPGSDGELPLMKALESEHWEALLARFVSLGADINQLDANGFAPIHHVTQQYEAPLVKHFLQLGADPLLKAEDGRTAFTIAAQNDSFEKIKVLLGKIETNDARALDIVKSIAQGFRMSLMQVVIEAKRLDLAESFLMLDKQAGVKPAVLPKGQLNDALDMLSLAKGSPHFLYLVAEQYLGWEAIFSNWQSQEKFLDLFNNPNVTTSEDLRPLFEAASSKKKTGDFLSTCIRYCNDANERFREMIAPLLWEAASSDPQIRQRLFESLKRPVFEGYSKPIVAQIIVRFCLDDFLNWDGKKDPDVGALLKEALTYLPEEDPKFAKLLELAVKMNHSFASSRDDSVCAQAVKQGRFTIYFKMVEASLNQQYPVDIQANEALVPPDLLASYNDAKSKIPQNLQIALAIKAGDLEKLSSLVASGIDLKNPTFMRAAVTSGQWKLIEYLLQQGASFTPADYPDQKEVFHQAVRHNVPELIPLLKAQGWDITKAGNDGMLVITHAMQFETYKTIVPLLIQAGASINALDWKGLAPIHHMIDHSWPEGLEFLLQQGADISRPTAEGHTALHLAFQNQSKELLDLLLKKGANLHQMTRLGQTPLQEALQDKNPLCKALIADLFARYNPAGDTQTQSTLDVLLEDIGMQNVTLQQAASTLFNKSQECTNDAQRASCLHLALLLHDKPTMLAISQQMAPEAFAACCTALEKIYPETAVSMLRYSMYSINPEYFKAGAKPQEDKIQEQTVDPNSLRQAFTGLAAETALNTLLDAIQNGTFPSGIDKIAPEALDPAKQAYFDNLRPLQILSKAQRLLTLIANPEKRAALQKAVSEATSAEELHKAYMEVLLYHVENQFSQINFSDPKLPNYRDPTKLTFFGEPKTAEELQENLNKVLTFTKNRTAYTGTPSKGTKELETFYSKLEGKLDEFVQELVTHTDPDQQATVLLDLAKETGYCAAKWIQFVSASRDTLRGKVEVVTFEDKFYQVLQDFRSGVIQEMVTAANVHEYNHYVSKVGQELNLPDADTFADYHDIFEEQFMKREEIRSLFDTLNSPERNVAFAKSFLEEEYKKNRDMTVEWLGAHVPKDWPYSVADYLEEQIFDEEYKLRTTAAVQFLKSLPIPVLNQDQATPKG